MRQETRRWCLFVSTMAISVSILSGAARGIDAHGGGIRMAVLQTAAGVAAQSDIVTYEAFGAKGDGVADDLPAICKAHDHANANGLSVRARSRKRYSSLCTGGPATRSPRTASCATTWRCSW